MTVRINLISINPHTASKMFFLTGFRRFDYKFPLEVIQKDYI